MVINLRLTLVIILGKIISFLLEHFGTGGTAAPGLIALKICPSLIKQLSGQLEKNIVVTGTNGKTTTTRMLAAILEQAHIKFIHNRYGSNLLRGIASTMIKETTLFGKMPENCLGLWEVDEAAFLPACQEVNPQIILITNLFRDQLDRYGEIDTLASNWRKALKMLPEDALVILNADDATVASLVNSVPGSEYSRRSGKKELKSSQKVIYFGLANQNLGGKKPDHASDATVCPYCFSNLDYKSCFVGHLGIYSCRKCGQIQPQKKVYLSNIILKPDKQKTIEIKNDQQIIRFTTTLPGTYNLYNFTAATCLGLCLKISNKVIAKGLSSFIPAFGRVEKVKVADKTLNIFLVKNPTGFNEVIDTLISNRKHTRCGSAAGRQTSQPRSTVAQHHTGCVKAPKITCLIAINDLIADGRDVSWLWDVDFEKLAPRLKKVIVSGIRAYDMALRLKYSNETLNQNKFGSGQAIKQYNNIVIEPNLKKAIQALLKTNDQQLYILPTYTAMLETRKILNKMGLVHSSWED